ncbi:hypothetical protein [Nocardia cyriacigeorgica]|uniref:hypothetical protein n=1 Tax=Nocardia cyriacigeorgica TaxID=135487 RepID=UPI0024559D8D|nr:hypothetical protein [Nocardia cyriacigeorgica]
MVDRRAPGAAPGGGGGGGGGRGAAGGGGAAAPAALGGCAPPARPRPRPGGAPGARRSTITLRQKPC